MRPERYARHLSLTGLGEAGQRALLDAHVLVVGAGGLGSPVVTYLGASGVGRISVIDADTVEISNLPRQVAHIEAMIGALKVQSVKRAVEQQNSDVEVRAVARMLTVDDALAEVAACDLVVDCSDSAQVRYLLNDACVALSVPLVWASLAEHAGQLGVVDPGRGACYRCIFPDVAALDGGLTCEQAGVLGVLPGVLGTMQAIEVVKLLTGIGRPASDAVRFYDALTATMTCLPVVPDETCVACGQGRLFVGVEPAAGPGLGAAPSVGASAAADRAVIDVREPEEIAVAPLRGVLASAERHERPFADWWSSQDVEAIERWSAGRPIAVVCARGVRSARAAGMLVAAGLDAVSVAGGVAGLEGDGDDGDGLAGRNADRHE